MKRSFIAVVLAASLTLTGVSTTQARADSDDIARILLGLVVVGAIAKAVDDRNDRREARRNAEQAQNQIPQVQYLPRRCLRPFQTHRGTRYGFGANCLQRHAHNVQLPARCERHGENRRGNFRLFYGETCMARRGYRIAG